MSEEKAVWVKFYPSDWLAGTRGMSSSETGVYITLIALMYEREGEVELNVARLARMCGTSNSAFKRALDVLIDDEKITLSDGKLSQKRVLEELSNTQKRRALASQAANSRWEKNPRKSTPDDMREQCDSNADAMPRARDSQSQSQKKEKSTKKELLPAVADDWKSDQEFVALWDRWKTTPNGAGRSKTPAKIYPIFCRHRTSVGIVQIMAGVEAYLKHDDFKLSGGKALDRWLNDEKYLGYARQVKPKHGKPRHYIEELQQMGIAI